MSEISNFQNYMCGYENGKFDVLNKIRGEIEEYKSRTVFGIGIKDLETGKQIALENVLAIIDRYRKNDT